MESGERHFRKRNLFKWQILFKKISVRGVVIISRIRMAENLGRGLGKKTVNITYLNNKNGRILVGIKSQEILG